MEREAGPSLLVGVVVCLRIAFCAMCVGVAHASLRYGDAIGTTLFMDWRWSDGASSLVVDAGACGLLAAGILLWFRRTAWAIWFVTCWMTALMIATCAQSETGTWLVPLANASRYAGPVALWLSVSACAVAARSGALPPARIAAAEWILRTTAAATFIGHGVQALWCDPGFLDLVFAAGESLLGAEVAQSDAELALRAVGALDLVLAIGVLATRSRFVVLYMAAWGFVTAASRIVHWGVAEYQEAILRLPNSCVPLALFLLWRARRHPTG